MNCIICGNEFKPKNQLAQICYKEHYNLCIYCGNNFLIKSIRHINRNFCFNKDCINKSRTENRKKTCNIKYGTDHYMKLDKYKEKVLNTNKQNNNGKLAWNTEKQKKTMLERYGVDNPGKSIISQEKRKLTSLKRYNSSTYNNPEKQRKTINNRYKINSSSQLQFTEFQRDIILNKENFEKFIDERYEDYLYARKIYSELNITHSVFFRYLDKYNLREKYKFRSNISYPELEIREYIRNKLKDIVIKPNYRKYIKQYGEIDIYLPEISLGIEFNGCRWHNKEEYLKDLKNNTITCRELIKLENFKNIGIEIINIWGDDYYNDKDIILKKLIRKIKHLYKYKYNL